MCMCNICKSEQRKQKQWAYSVDKISVSSFTHVSLFVSGSTKMICVAVMYSVPMVGFFVLYLSIIRTLSTCNQTINKLVIKVYCWVQNICRFKTVTKCKKIRGPYRTSGIVECAVSTPNPFIFCFVLKREGDSSPAIHTHTESWVLHTFFVDGPFEVVSWSVSSASWPIHEIMRWGTNCGTANPKTVLDSGIMSVVSAGKVSNLNRSTDTGDNSSTKSVPSV